MKASLVLTLACAAGLGISMAGFAAEPAQRADTKDTKVETKTIVPAEIKGEVLKVDGDNYLVNDERSKKEVKFTMEKDVKATLDRPLKQGDRIEAYLTPEGLAKKVRFEGAKDPADLQSPREIPSGGSGHQDQGAKPPEGSNPTLSPSGKGSASGG